MRSLTFCDGLPGIGSAPPTSTLSRRFAKTAAVPTSSNQRTATGVRKRRTVAAKRRTPRAYYIRLLARNLSTLSERGFGRGVGKLDLGGEADGVEIAEVKLSRLPPVRECEARPERRVAAVLQVP